MVFSVFVFLARELGGNELKDVGIGVDVNRLDIPAAEARRRR